jgi:acylglycerol lipase
LDDDGKNTPLFMMGHSMGGAEVLCYIAQGPSDTVSKFRGFLCEAPFLSLHKGSKPGFVTMLVGRFAGKILPHRQMMFPLDEKFLSRDPQVQKDFVGDKLCHDTGTLEGLAGNLDRADGLDNGKILVREGRGEGGKTRVWLSHGTEDAVCDCKSTERLYDRMKEVKDKELKLYKGWYHKRKCLPLGDGAVHIDTDLENSTWRTESG